MDRGLAADVIASPLVARARARLGLAYVLSALGVFAVLFALVRTNRSAAADLAITLRLQRRRWPWLERLMWLVSWPGFPPQSRLLPPLLALLWWRLGLRLEASMQLLAWGTSGISGFFKLLMRRKRPAAPEVRVVVARLGGSSFPSGHVLNYIGTFGVLAYLVQTLVRPAALRRPIVASLVAAIILVGPSRIYEGHHWPTDVLASYLLGTSYLAGIIALYQRLKATDASPGRFGSA
jgi:undecaprenyl-diphosphatase